MKRHPQSSPENFPEKSPEKSKDNPYHVLIVEDSEECQLLLRRTLEGEFRVTSAGTLKAATEALARGDIDLLILDVQLPDGDGFVFLKSLREEDPPQLVPVIFLTVKSQLAHKMHGFELGAEDYICKPFEPLEVMARVKANLRTPLGRTEKDHRILGGGLAVDLVTQKVSWSDPSGSSQVELTPMELKLLCKFIQTPNQIIARDDLKISVWGKSIHVSPRAIDKLVSSLKNKLATRSRQIRSIYRKGYLFKDSAEK